MGNDEFAGIQSFLAGSGKVEEGRWRDFLRYLRSRVECLGRSYAPGGKLTPATVEDLVQDVLVILTDKAARLEPMRSFGGYTAGVARNVVRSYCRQPEINQMVWLDRQGGEMPDNPIEDKVVGNERWKQALAAVAGLPAAQREVVVRRIMGESYEAIAGRLQISEEAARKRFERAIRSLRRVAMRIYGEGE